MTSLGLQPYSKLSTKRSLLHEHISGRKSSVSQRDCFRHSRRAPVSARLRVAKWWPESWEDADQPPEQTITFFSADGSLSTVGNPAVISSFSDPTPRQIIEPLPAPIDQGLCIGSVFHINATNGVDTTRRIKLLGFCHSLEYLHDKVEGTVIRRGGEIFAAERGVKSGVSEYLTMTIAMPLLFGIPPEYDHLKTAVKQGGGVLHQIQKEWWLI